MKRGFTLIELLVVVLIIGILSSVALPQYTKSVEKSRSTEAVTLLGNLANAEQIYTMNGEGYTNDLELHCKSLFLVNLDTDTVVYTHNPDEKVPMASVTKIMTFIVAYENISDPENTIINTGESFYYDLMGTGSSMSGLYMNEDLTALQLYNMMLIPSGNDASHVLAEYVAGSVEAFAVAKQGMS